MAAKSENGQGTPPDALSLLTQLRQEIPDQSQAVALLYRRMLETARTFPCRSITSVADLDDFLRDRCPHRYFREPYYNGPRTFFAEDPDGRGLLNQFGEEFGDFDFDRVNPDNMHSSDRALFVLVHPPSGVESSNGSRAFVSLGHHNFTTYSDLLGPHLAVTLPGRTARKALPFECIEKFDGEDVFLDRAGTGNVADIGNPNENTHTVFVDQISERSDDGPRASGIPKLRVLVPLQRDGTTVSPKWKIFGIPTEPSLIENADRALPPAEPAGEQLPEGVTTASYINLETGNRIFDHYFHLSWALTAIAVLGIGATAGYLGIKHELINIKSAADLIAPVAGLVCCAGLAWPAATLAWAMHRDGAGGY